MGKSELLKKSKSFFKGKSIYYECLKTTYDDNIKKLCEQIADLFNEKFLLLNCIEEILSFLHEKSKQENILLIIGEYPFLRENKKGLDSIFQTYIDNNQDDNLKIVFCGSFPSIMQELIEKHEPLFGRFRLILKLNLMSFGDAIKCVQRIFHMKKK